MEAGAAQRFDERDHGGCLAGPADRHIADHHHWHADAHPLEPAERKGGAPRGGDRGEHPGERQQCPCKRAALLPLAREVRFDLGFDVAHWADAGLRSN
jgi:hypothetical protein